MSQFPYLQKLLLFLFFASRFPEPSPEDIKTLQTVFRVCIALHVLILLAGFAFLPRWLHRRFGLDYLVAIGATTLALAALLFLLTEGFHAFAVSVPVALSGLRYLNVTLFDMALGGAGAILLLAALVRRFLR